MQYSSTFQHAKSSIHETYVQYHKSMLKSYNSPIKSEPSRYKKSDRIQQRIRGGRFSKISGASNKLSVELANLSLSSIQGRTELFSLVKESYFHESINGKHNNSNEALNQNELDCSQWNLKKKIPYPKDQLLSTEPILINLNESVDQKKDTTKINQKLPLKEQYNIQLVNHIKLSSIPLEQQSLKLNHAKQNIHLSSIPQKRSNNLSQSQNTPSSATSYCNFKSKLLESNLFDADDPRNSYESSNIKGTVMEIIKLSGNDCEQNKPLLEQRSQQNQKNRKDSQCESYEKEKSSSQSSQQDDYEQKIKSIKHAQSQISQQLKQNSFIEKKSQQLQQFSNQAINVKKYKVIENPILQKKALESKDNGNIKLSESKVLNKKSDVDDDSDKSSDYDSKIIKLKTKPKIQLLNSTQIKTPIIQTQLHVKKDSIKKLNNRYGSDQQWTSSEQENQQELQKEQLETRKQQNQQQSPNQKKIMITLVQTAEFQKQKRQEVNGYQDSEQDQDLNDDYENTFLEKTGSQRQNIQIQSEKINKCSKENQIISNEYTQNLSLKGTEKVLIENQNNQNKISLEHEDKKFILKGLSQSSSRNSNENQYYDIEEQEKSLSQKISQHCKPNAFMMNASNEKQQSDIIIKKSQIEQQKSQQNNQNKIENYHEQCLRQVRKHQQLLKERQSLVISRVISQNMCESKIMKNINDQQGQSQFSSQIKQKDLFIPNNQIETILTTTLTNAILPQLTSSIVSSLRQSLNQQISQQVKAHNELLYYQLKDCLLEEISEKFKSLKHFITDQIRVTKQDSYAMLLKQQNNEEYQETLIRLQKEQKAQCSNRDYQFQTISKKVEYQSPIYIYQNQQQSSHIKQRFQQIRKSHRQNLFLNKDTHQQKQNNIQHSHDLGQQFIQIPRLREQLVYILKTQISKEIKSTLQNEVRHLFKEEFHNLIRCQIKEEIHQQLTNLFPKNQGETLKEKHQIENQFQYKQSILPQQKKLFSISFIYNKILINQFISKGVTFRNVSKHQVRIKIKSNDGEQQQPSDSEE